MSDNIIQLTREEVIALARNTKNELEKVWNYLLTEIDLRGKTNMTSHDYIDIMKKMLDRLEVIIRDGKIKRFENDDPSKTLNCPSVFVTGLVQK